MISSNYIFSNSSLLTPTTTPTPTPSQLVVLTCERLNSTELIYKSGEEYLIMCLKLCALINKQKCNINDLIDFKQIKKTNKTQLIHLLNNLSENECLNYANRESYKLILFIFGFILSFFILILNSLTLFTIKRTKRLHTITNILIFNLSLSDFLSGISFLYPCTLNLLTIYSLKTYNFELYEIACNLRQYYYLCLVAYAPMITSMLNSILTLTLIAVEKYIAILKPYLYEKLILKRNFILIPILINWLISIFISLLPLMGWNLYNKSALYRGFSCLSMNSIPCRFEKIFTIKFILLFTSLCFVCALLMFVIYVRIYFISRKHSKQIAQLNRLPLLLNGTGKHSTSTSKLIRQFNLNLNIKAMKTLLILLVGFYACWLPLIIYFLIYSTKFYNNLTIYILMFISTFNALIDPIVYAFRNREFRNSLLSIFKINLNK